MKAAVRAGILLLDGKITPEDGNLDYHFYERLPMQESGRLC